MRGPANSDDTQVETIIRRWIHEVVIGLRLCPGAAPVEDATRVVVCRSEAPEDILREGLSEAIRLLDDDAIPTTLVVFPDALADFEDYLDAVVELEGALSDGGADGLLQVASFHPDYQFADTDADDPANWTNRAPWPVIHLIRESDLSALVDTHPDIAGVPDANIQTMRIWGVEKLTALWRGLFEG